MSNILSKSAYARSNANPRPKFNSTTPASANRVAAHSALPICVALAAVSNIVHELKIFPGLIKRRN